MTRHGIEPRSHGPWANTLPTYLGFLLNEALTLIIDLYFFRSNISFFFTISDRFES